LESVVGNKHLPAGLTAIAFSIFGSAYIVRSLLRALKNGFSTGKLGAIHQAGTVQYTGFIVACAIGIALMLALAFLGSRWAGFIKGSNGER
jgi:hypothetical protein